MNKISTLAVDYENLLRECANTLRKYEAHHLVKARQAPAVLQDQKLATIIVKDQLEKARENGDLADRIERLIGEEK